MAIVAFHVTAYPVRGWPVWAVAVQEVLLKWPVPFFFATAGYLHGASEAASSPAWLKRRVIQLGVPYGLWTTLRLVDLRPITPRTLLFQYLLHVPTSTLWFLWTLVLCTLLAWLALRLGLTARALLGTSLALAIVHALVTQAWQVLGGFGAAIHDAPWYAYQSPTLWLWVYCAALWLSRSLGAQRPRSIRPGVAVAPLGACIAVVVVRYAVSGFAALNPFAYHFGWGVLGLWQGAFGIATLLCALLAVRPSGRLALRLSQLSLGLYLVHPAVLRVLRVLSERDLIGRLLHASPFLVWFVVLVASLGITYILSLTPGLRWFVALPGRESRPATAAE